MDGGIWEPLTKLADPWEDEGPSVYKDGETTRKWLIVLTVEWNSLM